MVAAASDALAALALSCPDNHLHLASHGGTADIVGAVAAAAAALPQSAPEAAPAAEAAADALAELCLVLTKCAATTKQQVSQFAAGLACLLSKVGSGVLDCSCGG